MTGQQLSHRHPKGFSWPTSAACLAAVAVLLVGCTQSRPGAVTGQGATPSAAPSATTATTAAGTATTVAGPTTTAAGTTGDAGPGTTLLGRTFVSDSVDGHDLAAGTTITLEFTEDGGLRAAAGCNSIVGPVDVADGVLRTGDLAMTEMGCPETGLAEQDTWLAGFLSSTPTFELAGDTLTLHGEGDEVTVTLIDQDVTDADHPLLDTTWHLDGIIDGDSVSSVPQGLSARLRITRAGPSDQHDRLALTVCNTRTSSVVIEPGPPTTLRLLDDGGSTQIGCDDRADDLEEQVHTMLEGTVTVVIDGDLMTVLAEDGSGLMLRAEKVGPTDPTWPGHPTTGSSASSDPTPSSDPDGPTGPPTAELLAGRTFTLTRLFTDAGGVDTRLPGATFTITFSDHGTATATSQCGEHTYDRVVVGADSGSGGLGLPIDLGTPTGPPCDLGTDPPGIPSGTLYFGGDAESGFYLSTGFVAWYFEEELS